MTLLGPKDDGALTFAMMLQILLFVDCEASRAKPQIRHGLPFCQKCTKIAEWRRNAKFDAPLLCDSPVWANAMVRERARKSPFRVEIAEGTVSGISRQELLSEDKVSPRLLSRCSARFLSCGDTLDPARDGCACQIIMPLCHGVAIAVDHVSNARSIELAATSISVLPQGIMHRITSSSARSPVAVVVCLEQLHLDEMSKGAIPLEIRLAIGERHLGLQRLLQAIVAELKGNKIGASVMIEGLSLQIGVIIARDFCVSSAAVVKGGLSPWQLRQVVEFMRQNLAAPISVADIAAISGLSRFHFTRAFRESAGIAPGQYLKQMRLERACDLLAQTELSIGDIATQTGYDAPQAFSRLFRQAIGTSPREYRQAHRGA